MEGEVDARRKTFEGPEDDIVALLELGMGMGRDL